jgi:hypothetical protein
MPPGRPGHRVWRSGFPDPNVFDEEEVAVELEPPLAFLHRRRREVDLAPVGEVGAPEIRPHPQAADEADRPRHGAADHLSAVAQQDLVVIQPRPGLALQKVVERQVAQRQDGHGIGRGAGSIAVDPAGYAVTVEAGEHRVTARQQRAVAGFEAQAVGRHGVGRGHVFAFVVR